MPNETRSHQIVLQIRLRTTLFLKKVRGLIYVDVDAKPIDAGKRPSTINVYIMNVESRKCGTYITEEIFKHVGIFALVVIFKFDALQFTKPRT